MYMVSYSRASIRVRISRQIQKISTGLSDINDLLIHLGLHLVKVLKMDHNHKIFPENPADIFNFTNLTLCNEPQLMTL